MSDFDAILRRSLQSGTEYEGLFPKVECKSTYVGTGNTDLSISEMEKVIVSYALQTEKIAKKLQRNSVQDTADAIHNFLFNYFQYKADDSNQMLRSPACSWKMRKDGIDCKSYSILASSILLNLKITHYVRKIKQPGHAPNDFTHVYVIVPINQKTGSLNDGYLVVDGTLRSNIEPAFIGKKDLKMDGLKHYALNGSTMSNTGRSNFGFGDVKRLNWKSVKSFINGIGCMGWNGKEKSSFTHDQLIKHLDAVDLFFHEMFADMNDAIRAKNPALFSKIVAEYITMSTLFSQAMTAKRGYNYNRCTTDRITVGIGQFNFYKNQIGPLLQAYLNKYFTAGSTIGSVVINNQRLEQDFAPINFVFTPTVISVTTPIKMYNPIPSASIPEFVLNKYVQDQAIEGNSINTQSFLNLVETAGVLIQTVAGGSGGGSGPFSPGGGTLNPNFPSDPKTSFFGGQGKTSTAGGWVVGGIVALVALNMAFGKKTKINTKL